MAAPVGPGPHPAWLLVGDVALVRQGAPADCGVASLAMALQHGGLPMRVQDLSAMLPVQAGQGILASDLRDLARKLGFEAYLFSATIDDLTTEITRGHPVVVGLLKTVNRTRFSHYELVVGLRRDGARILTIDPAHGQREQSVEAFLAEWAGSRQAALVVWR